MGLLSFLKRDPMELSFKDFIKKLEKVSGSEYAYNFKDRVMDLLLKDTSLLYSDIEKMKWKDISYKIKKIERQTQLELETLDAIIATAGNASKSNDFLGDPSWQYGLENVFDEDDMR